MLDQRALDRDTLDPVVLGKVLEGGVVGRVNLLVVWQLAYRRLIVVVVIDFAYVKCDAAELDVGIGNLDVKLVQLIKVLLEPAGCYFEFLDLPLVGRNELLVHFLHRDAEVPGLGADPRKDSPLNIWKG